jgi:glycosyltransferase involved in cell wall biosynthesis
MRFFYLDPGLHDDVGHRANYCRYIVGELRSRGVETLVFGYHEVAPALQTEFGIALHFRAHAYTGNDDDPFCGWLTGFDRFTRLTCEDLFRLPATEPADLVFAPSVRPVQLSALIKWRRALPPDRRPTVVVESVSTGLVIRRGSDGLHVSVPDPRIDPRATLFRYIASRLPREDGARFHFITFGPIPTELFNLLLKFPVRTLPLPFRAVAPLRNRAGARPVVVAILGHHRLAKGYDRLPEIVQELLRGRRDIRLLVHSVAPSDSPETQQALRDIAASSDRVIFEENPVAGRGWAQLLNMSDVVLCPHRPEFYVAGVSVVAAEALANGIPVVVPAGTPLETLLAECGGPGTAFNRFEPGSIAAATGYVLDDFDRFATLAHAVALRWSETRGPARMVDGLMSLIGSR